GRDSVIEGLRGNKALFRGYRLPVLVGIDHESKGAAKRARLQLHQDVQSVLHDAGYVLAAEPVIKDEHRFCQLHLTYPTILEGQPSDGLRANIRLEFSFHALKLLAADQKISSFVAMHRQTRCEVDAM